MSDLGVLLRRECRRALRSPVVWAVLSLLLVAGTWGALNTARLHTDQIADVAKMTRHEMEWYADIRVRAARYSQASSENLPYWQDPTGASGFRRYFLKRFAAKPHLPLSVLAVGQSDLQPFAVPLRLETLFGGDRVYDFEPPRALATGPFDLSLVLVFVIPLCIGAAVATIGAAERDQGILALIASQPITPRRWWCARLGALATILVPGVVLCVVIALARGRTHSHRFAGDCCGSGFGGSTRAILGGDRRMVPCPRPWGRHHGFDRSRNLAGLNYRSAARRVHDRSLGGLATFTGDRRERAPADNGRRATRG
jgi:ABC-type transport system involved in multi-copper enzyme maturation permease subunit